MTRRWNRVLGAALAVFAAAMAAHGHVGDHPSIHDTVAGVVERMRTTLPGEELPAITPEKAAAFLTAEEKRILGAEYLLFTVDAPVIVTVIRDARLGDEPFWLQERGFAPTGEEVRVGSRVFDTWEKAFDAGEIGLGVNSLSGGGDHYFVAVRPREPGASVDVTDVYPGYHETEVLRVGARGHFDRSETIDALPASIDGAIGILGTNDRRREAQLTSLFRTTLHPASERPDHVVLTWSDDPRTTQTIQWRTSADVRSGALAYQKKAEYRAFAAKAPREVAATTERMETPDVVNDPAVNRHAVTLSGLAPDTTYVYSIQAGADGDWTEPAEFTTAPAETKPFSFVYMGDAQNGLQRWGSVIQGAHRRRPDAAFYVMAGDLVNRGGERDDWDLFFEMAEGVYDRRPVVPALGNHEYQNGDPSMYLRMFTLPTNGPSTLEPEKAYALRYSNALFLVLDSNQPADSQTGWIEEQLSTTDATWKFVVYHHPAYSSSPTRDNPEVREKWGALFDKYHVDMALQGHDHAYLRTYPMKAGERAASPAEGTIYVVSVSGTKYYELGDFEYTEHGMANTSTYQVLDIQVSGDRLVYRAYDVDGELRDTFVIEK